MKAVIFDVDGVIVDSETYWEKEKEKIIKQAFEDGSDLSPSDLTGIPVLDQYDKYSNNHKMKVTRKEYFDLYDKKAESIYKQKVTLLDDLPQFLNILKERNINIAICSSSYLKWINIILERFSLKNEFDLVITADSIDKRGKPEPYIYGKATEKFNVDPEECIAIEDSENGILAANRAGMYCIEYEPDNNKNNLSIANEIVSTPKELYSRIITIIEENR